MTPYDQLVLHEPSKNQVGDCFRTCLGCLLDRGPALIPHFVAEIEEKDYTHQALLENVNAWLRNHYPHLRYLDFILSDECFEFDLGYHIMIGPSPRSKGVNHCIIGYNGVPYHDPHPSKDFLAGKGYEVGLLIHVID